MSNVGDYRRITINFSTASDGDIVRYGLSKWCINGHNNARDKKKSSKTTVTFLYKTERSITNTNLGFLSKLLPICLAGAHVTLGDYSALYCTANNLFKYFFNKPLGVTVASELK